MKEHFCPAEQSTITYQGKCNWCGESETSMTQEALKLAIQLRDTASGYWTENEIPIIEKLIELLAQTQEPVAVYGYCPECGAKGVMRERRPNGNDKCANGHTYPSSTSTPPQRTWVGLTDEEMKELWENKGWYVTMYKAVEAKLKEKNT